MHTKIKEFLDKKNTFAVVGVSRNPDKYGYKVFIDLKNVGYDVFPINPNISKIDDIKSYRSLNDLPVKPDVVVCVVPPQITLQIVNEAKLLGISSIWLQPGSESSEVIKYCKTNNMNIIANMCIMIEK